MSVSHRASIALPTARPSVRLRPTAGAVSSSCLVSYHVLCLKMSFAYVTKALSDGQHSRFRQRSSPCNALRSANRTVDYSRPGCHRRVQVISFYSLSHKLFFFFYCSSNNIYLLLTSSSSGSLVTPYVFNGFMAHVRFRSVDDQQQQPHRGQQHYSSAGGATFITEALEMPSMR